MVLNKTNLCSHQPTSILTNQVLLVHTKFGWAQTKQKKANMLAISMTSNLLYNIR